MLSLIYWEIGGSALQGVRRSRVCHRKDNILQLARHTCGTIAPPVKNWFPRGPGTADCAMFAFSSGIITALSREIALATIISGTSWASCFT